MCSINFVWPTFDRQYRVVQYQVLTHPPPTSRQNKLAKRRHVMVCHWHISKYCVQMYDIIRLYFGGQKHVVLSEKLYGFHLKRFLYVVDFSYGAKIVRNYFSLGNCTLYLYFLRERQTQTHFWEDKSNLTYVQGKAQGTILVYTVYTSSLLQKTAEKPLFGNHVQSNCPISLI